MSSLRLTRAQVREVDRLAIEEYGIPGVVLMENAARAVVDYLAVTQSREGRIAAAIIYCGKGNNGGDGFAIARHLLIRSWDVHVVLCCRPDEITGDAKVNFEILRKMKPAWHVLDRFELTAVPHRYAFVLDAIYGTGFRPPAGIDLAAINGAVAGAGHWPVAIDLPSGLDADTGTVLNGNGFRARTTVTFVAEKTGFANAEAAAYLGEVVVGNIGVPDEIIEQVRRSPG